MTPENKSRLKPWPEPSRRPGLRRPITYEIKVKGHLDEYWSEWFGGLTVRYDEQDDTILTGPVTDQAALHGCMLISMGTLAMRDQLDISGTRVDVELAGSEKRIETIDLTFTMPRNYSKVERIKLQRAAELCPIEHSFHPDIPISVRYDYPDS